jgi:hypothetical protein
MPHSDAYFRTHIVAGSLLAVCLFLGPPIHAQSGMTTYTFVGPPFNAWYSTACPPECRLTGSFTTTAPIPALFYGRVNPSSYSFTDGTAVMTDLNSYLTNGLPFLIQTDDVGNIMSWGLEVSSWNLQFTDDRNMWAGGGVAYGGYESDGSWHYLNGSYYTARYDGLGSGVWYKSSGSSTLAILSGNGQTGDVNTVLANPLIIKVTDGNGNPVPGTPISFQVTQQPQGAVGASLSVSYAGTAANGTASTQLTLGNLQGQYQVTASCVSANCTPSTLVFSETAAQCGDERDNLIAEYTQYGVSLHPQCNWFTQNAQSAYFTFDQINHPCPSHPMPEFSWALVKQSLVAASSSGHGLDRWQDEYRKLTGNLTDQRVINSGYRDPVQNAACGSTAPNSRHQYGDAVDLMNVSRTGREWKNIYVAAKRAGTYLPTDPTCNLKPRWIGCVHGDYRNHASSYAPVSVIPSGSQDRRLSTIAASTFVREVGSQSWEIRQRAFYNLVKWVAPTKEVPVAIADIRKNGNSSNEMRDALVRLLSRETAYVGIHPELSEEFYSYYADLVWAVCSLRDPKSLDALLGVITNGNIVTSAIASFGGGAMKPVIDLLDNRDELVRDSAVEVLSEMLNPENRRTASSSEAREVIKVALLRASSDQSHYVRLTAVEALVKLGDAEGIRVVENIARTDPADASQYGGVEGFYPVREAAKSALLEREILK